MNNKKEIIFNRNKPFENEIKVQYLLYPNFRANLAIRIVEKHAFLLKSTKEYKEKSNYAYDSYSYDSKETMHYELYDSKEIVERACDIADKIFSELEKRNWIVEVPEELFNK